jgi:sugar transferase (PEP-CTERM/EpsH1 system associated)
VSQSQPPNLLYVTHRFPFPPDKGDRIRNFHVLRFLARRARVHLACLADEPVPGEALRTLQQECAQLAVVPIGRFARWWSAGVSLLRGGTASAGAFQSAALAGVLTDWAADTPFRAVLVSASSLAPYLGLKALRGVPAVVDLVDVDSEKWLGYAARRGGPRGWLYRLEGRRLRELERQLPERCAAVTLVSEAEAALYQSFCAPGRVAAVINGVDCDYFQPREAPTDLSCVFVGALDYAPNVEAVEWFCDRVWPDVRRRRSSARVRLVGRRPARRVRLLSGRPGVELVGQVADVRPELARAGVVIAPLQQARGIQNKVLEALAMGKAVIASPPAREGLAAEEGRHLCIATTPDEWCERLLQLWDEPELRRGLGAAGLAYVHDQHAWEQCLAPLAPLLGLSPQEAQDALAFRPLSSTRAGESRSPTPVN